METGRVSDQKKTDCIVQVLVAAVNKDVHQLAEDMNLQSDAIIVNQCDRYDTEAFEHNGRIIKAFYMAERGVGLSRNTALMRSGAPATGRRESAETEVICLFSDQDIVYRDGYEAAMLSEFKAHPEADMILFNVEVREERKTYENTSWKKVHWYNCGRYGAVSFAIRRDFLLQSQVTYSLLFGGGAKYSAGEDSLFLKQLMDRGCHVYASPVTIGKEVETESTWFKGYDTKFFFDRGVLYHYLYGALAKPWAFRFLYAHRNRLCGELSLKEAYRIMKDGMKSVR